MGVNDEVHVMSRSSRVVRSRRGALNAGFSHDFSNIMMTILGHADLARSRVLSGLDGTLDHLAEIEGAARRAIDLCRTLCDPKETRQIKEKGEAVETTKFPLTGGRVLLVDDESSVRAVARQMLERIGFDVESAVDGADALELFEQNPHRFVFALLDLSMPGMNGDICFSRMRGLRPDLPVLFSSGSNDRAMAEPLVEAPLTTFLQKPYSMAALRRELQVLLGVPT